MTRRTHFDPFDEGLRSACRIEDRKTRTVTVFTVTSDVTKVDCRLCRETPEFDAALLVVDVKPLHLVSLAHDRLLLLEPRDHRTLDQISAWSTKERADVAVWAGRCHLRAGDHIVAEPPRPDVMDRDPEPTVPEATDIFGPRVCYCEEATA